MNSIEAVRIIREKIKEAQHKDGNYTYLPVENNLDDIIQLILRLGDTIKEDGEYYVVGGDGNAIYYDIDASMEADDKSLMLYLNPIKQLILPFMGRAVGIETELPEMFPNTNYALIKDGKYIEIKTRESAENTLTIHPDLNDHIIRIGLSQYGQSYHLMSHGFDVDEYIGKDSEYDGVAILTKEEAEGEVLLPNIIHIIVEDIYVPDYNKRIEVVDIDANGLIGYKIDPDYDIECVDYSDLEEQVLTSEEDARYMESRCLLSEKVSHINSSIDDLVEDTRNEISYMIVGSDYSKAHELLQHYGQILKSYHEQDLIIPKGEMGAAFREHLSFYDDEQLLGIITSDFDYTGNKFSIEDRDFFFRKLLMFNPQIGRVRYDFK